MKNVVYFGKINTGLLTNSKPTVPEGWEKPRYYRIRIEHGEEEIKLEDTCKRMVPFLFSDIDGLIKALTKAKRKIIEGSVN
jgi:hypothetical protein